MSERTKLTEATVQATQTTSAAASRGVDQAVGAFKDTYSQAAAGFEKSQVKFKEGFEKAMKTAEELAKFNQGNFEALVKSGQIWASGVQDITKQAAASAQAVPLLKQHIQPATGVDEQRLKRLLTDLDSPRFSTRQAATPVAPFQLMETVMFPPPAEATSAGGAAGVAYQ